MSLFFPSNEKDKLPSAFMRKRKICFPTKLQQMLSDVDTEETISWLPHGRAWKIHSMKRFEETTLKKYFPHCKLSSFMRLVNRWHFERVKNGPDKNAYYNEVRKWYISLMSLLFLLKCIAAKLLKPPIILRNCRYYSFLPTHLVFIWNCVFRWQHWDLPLSQCLFLTICSILYLA